MKENQDDTKAEIAKALKNIEYPSWVTERDEDDIEEGKRIFEMLVVLELNLKALIGSLSEVTENGPMEYCGHYDDSDDEFKDRWSPLAKAARAARLRIDKYEDTLY